MSLGEDARMEIAISDGLREIFGDDYKLRRNKMAFEQRDMSGAFFKNDKKGNEKAPDYTGNAMVDGFEYRISAWVKDGAKGKFMSMTFSRKDEVAKEKPVEIKPADHASFDDQIPF